MSARQWFIFEPRRRVYWRPQQAGYTTNPWEAGRYGDDEALAIECHWQGRTGRDGAQLDVQPGRQGAISPAAPMRSCRDCALDLGDAIHAAFVCPLFGRPRSGVQLRCLAFKPCASGTTKRAG